MFGTDFFLFLSPSKHILRHTGSSIGGAARRTCSRSSIARQERWSRLKSGGSRMERARDRGTASDASSLLASLPPTAVPECLYHYCSLVDGQFNIKSIEISALNQYTFVYILFICSCSVVHIISYLINENQYIPCVDPVRWCDGLHRRTRRARPWRHAWRREGLMGRGTATTESSR
jgi:hypothetical protein